jgi:ABC-type proline/glycine betaine transport system substrate-binding protein
LLSPDYNVDQYKKGFTEEETRQYQQLKKAGLSDEKINEMMYLFAKNNQKSETTAKLGGRLINAYTRTKSQ